MVNAADLGKKERDELIEQRKQEMLHMLPNQFTFCFNQKISSKPIIIKERNN